MVFSSANRCKKSHIIIHAKKSGGGGGGGVTLTASSYFYCTVAIMNEDESLSEIRLNKNGTASIENAVGLFL